MAKQILTKIVPQQRVANRVSIYVNNKFFCGLPQIDAERLGLVPGAELDVAKIVQLKKVSDTEKARVTALRLLTIRPRSRKELANRLKQKGYDCEQLSAVLQELQDNAYLDDEKFARWFVESKSHSKQYGRRLLYAELLKRGIQAKLAEQVTNSMLDVDQETEQALRFAQKKLRTLKKESVLQKRKKLYDALLRRGFSAEIGRRIISTVLKEKSTEIYVD